MNDPRAEPISGKDTGARWQGLDQRRIWGKPLPGIARRFDRFLCRFFLACFHSRLLDVQGLEHIHPDNDPFIVVLNHNQRVEALLLPLLMIHHRSGRMIHFLTDWIFYIIPVVGSYYRRSQAIIVMRKDAKLRVFNRLKPWLAQPGSAMERAMKVLAEGRSVGIFPEGTINRHPTRLLRGSPSAARLSLESGASVIPVGLRFPRHEGDGPIGDLEPLEVHFGAPLSPPPIEGPRAKAAEVRQWHARVMGEIARLSGKSWPE
ncbi:MAG: lysophospholipid acyltransferase family protein [Acidobacteriota bacterium]|nr:lysophospholipid acyltransferase family protein [Acidobacteriota bacterium]